MADYEVKIKTAAEGQGAQQAAAGLKQVTAEAEKANTQLKEGAKAGGQLEEKQKDLSKSTDGLTDAKKRWAGALQQLKEHIPGLGVAINLLKNPLAGVAAAIAILIVLVDRKRRAILDAMAADAKAAAEVGLLSIALGLHKTKWVDYADAIKKGQDAADAFKDHLGELEGTISRIEQAQKRFIALQKEQALVAINMRLAKGGITEEEANKLRAGVEFKAERAGEQAEDAALVAKWAAVGRELEQAKTKMAGAPDRLNEAKAKLDAFRIGEEGFGGIGGAAAGRKTALTDANKRLADAQQELAEVSQGVKLTPFGPRVMGFEAGSKADREYQQDIQAAREKIAAIELERRQLVEQDVAARQKGQSLEKEFSTAEKFFTTGGEQVKSLEQQRNTLGGQILQTRLQRQAMAPLQQQILGGTEGVEDAKFMADYIKELMGKATDNQKKQNEATIRVMEKLFGATKEGKDQIEAFEKKLNALQGR